MKFSKIKDRINEGIRIYIPFTVRIRDREVDKGKRSEACFDDERERERKA